VALLWLIEVAVELAPILVGCLPESIRPAMRRAPFVPKEKEGRVLNRCSSPSGSKGG
jgi:hypothetical protein